VLSFFKTFLLVGAIRRIKDSLFIIIFSLVLIGIVNSFTDDILSIPSDEPYFILSIKWALILAFIVLIIFEIKKIINTNYLSNNDNEVMNKGEDDSVRNKKDNVLRKDKLSSRMDIILNKYKK